jgi:hypothetical protein
MPFFPITHTLFPARPSAVRRLTSIVYRLPSIVLRLTFLPFLPDLPVSNADDG